MQISTGHLTQFSLSKTDSVHNVNVNVGPCVFVCVSVCGCLGGGLT